MFNKEKQMNETKVPKGRVKDGKINISLNPETVEMLVVIKNKMGVEMGFNLTYSQAIQHLIAFYNRNNKTECQVDTLSQPTEGESNE
jgi:stringent starvation protein B